MGELVAEIIFGPFALGDAIRVSGVPLVELKDIPNNLLSNSSSVIPQEFLATLYVRSFAEVGAIVILFIAGLSISFAQFRASGVASFTVAGFGVITPLVLIGIAVVGKVVGCGFPAYVFSRDLVKSLRVGVGMVSRGEVGLIVAGLGLTTGVLSPDVYGEIIFMIIATTIITPILLEAAYTRLKTQDEKPPVVALITKTSEEGESEAGKLEGVRQGR